MARFAGAAMLVTDVVAPRQQLFARCFYLVLQANSLSAAQTYHLGARDSGYQTLIFENILWRVLRHSYNTATPPHVY
jgi:hypothetical protein